MTAEDRDTQEERNSGLERLYHVRDRIAYSIFLRKDLGLKILLGSSFALCVFIFSMGLVIPRAAGEDPGWRISLPSAPFLGFFLASITTILGFQRPMWGILSTIVSLEILILIYAPGQFLLSVALLIFSVTVLLLARPKRGGLAALLTVPILENYFGIGLLAPLGFACFYPLGRAFWMTLTVVVWWFSIGVWNGSLPRIGYEGAPLYEAGGIRTLTFLNAPIWTNEMVGANLQRIEDVYDILVGKESLLAPFLIEVFLLTAVIWVVRTLHRPVGYKDRLALEYLSKEGEASSKGTLELFRQPLGIFLGVLLWIVGQLLVSVAFPGFYSSISVAGDIGSALAVAIIVILDYRGDPNMPLEFAQDPHRPAPKLKEGTGSLLSSSTFRIPTPSEMRLEYPGRASSPSAKGKDPSQLRLTTWKDTAKEEWKRPEKSGSATPPEKDKTPLSPPVSPSNSFAVGGKIDRQYLVEQVLQGGMGMVYIVTDEFSGVRYAIKTLKEDLRNNEEAVARFTSEAKTWIRLGHHQNIVQAMFYREIDGRALLFLEYVDGTDLEEVFSRPGPRPPLQSFLSWAIQFCDGMHFASTKELGGGIVGLVHRDIKPGNIMLTKDGVLKITDFGLAKVADAPTNLTREKVGLGTLKYMAPEQVKDAKHVDLRADIYSFGAVLYEGLSGRPPFVEDNSIDLYMAVLNKDPQRIRHLSEGIPDELDRIVMRCLQKDRTQRYSSFEELGWALRRFEDHLRTGGGGSHLRVVS